MQPFRLHVSMVRAALVLGTLAVTGCVPRAYVYDYPQTYYSGSGYGYYSAVQPGYYGYPGYYGPAGYPPTVVYVDQDHDRNDRDRGGHDGDKDGGRRDPGHDGHGDGRNDHDRHDRGPARSGPDHPVKPPRDNPEPRTPLRRGSEGHANVREVQP